MKKITTKTKNTALNSMLSCLVIASMLVVMQVPALGAPRAGADPSVPFGTAGTDPEQIFQLTIRTTASNTTFLLPTSGYLDGVATEKPYDWAIDWGDGNDEEAEGLSANMSGIAHSYSAAGNYTITITPNGSTEAWLAAFGFAISQYDANTLENKARVTGVLTPLRPEMTRTAAQLDYSEAPPSYELAYLFFECANLTKAPTLEGWENISVVGDYFAYDMYSACTSLAMLNDGIYLPADLLTAGDSFAENIFWGCTSLDLSVSSFNLPQSLMTVGDNFAVALFQGCTSLSTLADGFNLPQGLVSIGNGYCMRMFYNCSKLSTLPDGFNMPQSVSEVGNDYANSMFYGCSSLTSLPDGFNLTQHIGEAGNGFAALMFSGCSSLQGLPEGFTFPQTMDKVGDFFAMTMFSGCMSLGALPAGFNLPQNVVVTGGQFAMFMFMTAGSPTFQINEEFCFPAGIGSDAVNAFYMAFALSPLAPAQNRTAASIIGGCPTPADARMTFDAHFSDQDYIALNWGGKGLTPPVGAPGTGDLNGDGYVTMDEVMTTAQAAMGDIGLSPEQLACIDIDGDGYITMADVLMIYQMAIL